MTIWKYSLQPTAVDLDFRSQLVIGIIGGLGNSDASVLTRSPSIIVLDANVQAWRLQSLNKSKVYQVLVRCILHTGSFYTNSTVQATSLAFRGVYLGSVYPTRE